MKKITTLPAPFPGASAASAPKAAAATASGSRSTLPSRPSPPLVAVSDLLYDTRCRLAVNYDHILSDNIGRIPLPYLRDACNRYPAALALIDEAKNATAVLPHTTNICAALRCSGNQEGNLLSERIRSDFKRAIDKATRRIRGTTKPRCPFIPTYNSSEPDDHALSWTATTLPMWHCWWKKQSPATIDYNLTCTWLSRCPASSAYHSNWLRPNLISNGETSSALLHWRGKAVFHKEPFAFL